MSSPLKDVDGGGGSNDSEVHRELMKTILKQFRKERVSNIRANFMNMPVPEKTGEFTPDLTFRSSDKSPKFVILEVETCHTTTQLQSEPKFRLFPGKVEKKQESYS